MTPCIFAEQLDRTVTKAGTYRCNSPECDGDHTFSRTSNVFRLADGREVDGSRDLPPGAVYFAPILADFLCPHEPTCAEHLHAVCPNGRHWDVDSRASNCTLPDDAKHRCWVRHGNPRQPSSLHVDKDGFTCAAGAGSIQAGDYHGFLAHGAFT